MLSHARSPSHPGLTWYLPLYDPSSRATRRSDSPNFARVIAQRHCGSTCPRHRFRWSREVGSRHGGCNGICQCVSLRESGIGPARFKTFREACRNNFHLISCHMDSVVPSDDEKTIQRKLSLSYRICEANPLRLATAIFLFSRGFAITIFLKT